MKLNCKKLSSALKIISPAIQSSHIIPITSCVKIVSNRKTTTVTGTNTELTIVARFESDAQGEVILPFRRLSNICELYEEIEINLNKEVTITSEGDKNDFGVPESINNFPLLPDFLEQASIDVDGTFYYTLSQALSSVNKESMFNTGNVCIDVLKEETRIVSRDNASMYISTLPIRSKTEIQAVVPPSFVKATRSFQDSTISISEKFIKASTDNVDVYGRLYEGKYVNYNFALQFEKEPNVIASKENMLRAIQKIDSVETTETYRDMKLTLGEKLNISFYDRNTGKGVSTSIDVENKSEVNDILFDSSQMKKVVNQVDGENIYMRIESSEKPAIITFENTIIFIQPLKIIA